MLTTCLLPRSSSSFENDVSFSRQGSPRLSWLGLNAVTGVRFAQDHRELLALALPVGDRWFNWRARADEHVRRAIRWPFEGVLFDVENNVFWPSSWGERPDSVAARFEIVKRQVNTWLQLVPLYGHRYLPAAPSGPGAPVFSVHQTDVVIYGSNLLDYAAREFGTTRSLPSADVETCGLEPWSLLAFEEDSLGPNMMTIGDRPDSPSLIHANRSFQ